MAARENVTSWPQSAAIGDWQSGVQDYLPNWYTTKNFSNLVQRMTGGTGQEKYASNSPLPFSWQSAGNAVYDKRIRAWYESGVAGPPYVDSCETAKANGAIECYTRVRYFKPVTRVGNRYYGTQDVYERNSYEEYAGSPEGSYNYRRSSELVYYDCTGGACVSTAAIATPQSVRVRTTTGARSRGTAPVSMQPERRRISTSRQ
jgi:hypothetical protein